MNEFDQLTNTADTTLTTPGNDLGDVFEGDFNDADLRPMQLTIGHALSKSVKANPALLGSWVLDNIGAGKEIKVSFTNIGQSYEEDCELGKGSTGGRMFDTREEVVKLGLRARPVAFLSLYVQSEELGDTDVDGIGSVARATWVVRKSAYQAIVVPLRRWAKKNNGSGKAVSGQAVTIAVKEIQSTNGSYLVPEIQGLEDLGEEAAKFMQVNA